MSQIPNLGGGTYCAKLRVNRHTITVFSEISCPDQFYIQIMTSDIVLQVEPMQRWNLPTPPLCCCHVFVFFCVFCLFLGFVLCIRSSTFPAILSTSLLLNIHWFVHHSFISSFLQTCNTP